jgi:hypothetical protein
LQCVQAAHTQNTHPLWRGFLLLLPCFFQVISPCTLLTLSCSVSPGLAAFCLKVTISAFQHSLFLVSYCYNSTKKSYA